MKNKLMDEQIGAQTAIKESIKLLGSLNILIQLRLVSEKIFANPINKLYLSLKGV
ncbi:hypothetical protein DB42_DV00210 [Neochlamydia sp. EPS4]|nr:hypothetical protein DB42_DV00210 [Neochlamydia sp. EPS4]